MNDLLTVAQVAAIWGLTTKALQMRILRAEKRGVALFSGSPRRIARSDLDRAAQALRIGARSDLQERVVVIERRLSELEQAIRYLYSQE